MSAGCGGGTTNVIAVSVSSSVGNVLILGQSTTLTASVTGATNTNVNWETCMYTTTTTSSSGAVTTSTPATCLPLMGTLSNQQTSGTATFLAPQTLPDTKTYPGLQIIITAQSVQNTSKTGKITLTLNSGIGIVLTPTTATVPTLEQQAFQVQLSNDLQNLGVTWQITQQVPSSSTSSTPNPYFNLAPCTTCGSIDPVTGTYTAPSAVPTAITPAQTNNTNAPANVTVVATAKADQTRYALATITIILGGPITFNGITPKIAPQGATFWDILVDAPGITSASKILLNYLDSSNAPIGQPHQYDSLSGQIKITFPIPTSTTANPASSGARLRLFEADLKPPAGTASVVVTVTDPIQPVTPSALPTGAAAVPYTFRFVPVRPTATAIQQDDIVPNTLNQSTPITIDGGYFGPAGNLASIEWESPGTTLQTAATLSSSSSRQLNLALPSNLFNTGVPGLYPIYVKSGIAAPNPMPSPNNPAATNIAIFPDFSSVKPAVVKTPSPINTAGLNPSAIDIDPDLGVLAVADTGSNQVEFFQIGSGLVPLTPLSVVGNTPAAPNLFNVPTGISVNRQNHTAAVVNYGSLDSKGNPMPLSQSVTVLSIPGAPGTPITPFSVDLSNAFQGSVLPAPMPYSIGVDPDSGLALVAYSVNSILSVDNVGLIVNLNPNSSTNPYGCPLGNALNHIPPGQAGAVGQCIFSQVTLNNGIYPRIALAQHGHLAIVTPGGSGVVRGVDVTKASSANVLLKSSMTAGLVTVTIDATQCVPPTPNPDPKATPPTNPCPFSMIPGNAGTVLIANMVPTNSANYSLFNGLFTVNVTSGSTFAYVVPSTLSDQAAPPSGQIATVFYGGPDLTYSISSTLQGVAINPITNTAAMADANATGTSGAQIDLLSALDQSSSSISFFAGCTAFTPPPCPSQPELPPTTEVAWQPFTNTLVSYNPTQKLVSISDPVGRKRYAFLNLTGPSAVSFPVVNGTAVPNITLWGGLAVDAATNQAFVLESGSAVNKPGQIEIISLGPVQSASNTGPGVKSAHISDLIVPSATPGPGVIGGIPNALVPQATLTCQTPIPPATSCDLPNVQIFGMGFDSSTQVRLDSVSIPTGNVTFVSSRQLTATIPASALMAPHHYALDVLNGAGAQSNVTEFIVVQSVDLSNLCKDSTGNAINARPTSVAIADQLANGLFAPIALVSNQGCNSISMIDINPTITNAQGQVVPNPTFGQLIGNPISVGLAPQGIAISQRRGLAVVANNGAGTASVIDLTATPPVQKVPDVSTGTNPIGVAINEATDVALTANFNSNSVTLINYGPLFPPTGTAAATSLTPVSITGIQSPIAVAIDPDRGTTNQGIAVVSAIQLSNGAAPSGALAVVEIGLATPVLSATIPSGFVSSTPTGVVFDPAVSTGGNPGVFFANSSGTNSITEFNPDTGSGSTVSVGINPTSLAVNPQTGAILTSNTASNTVSVVDTLSSPFKTRHTLGLPGSPTFGVAIDQFTNLAVIVDQVNQRVLLFPMPN